MLILFSLDAVGFVLFLEGMPLLELTEPSFFLLTTSDHKLFHSAFTLLVQGQGKHPAGVSGGGGTAGSRDLQKWTRMT